MEKANNPPAEQSFATMWNRLTFSRLTFIYFCFTFLHFAAQIILQSEALSNNIHTLNILMGLLPNQTVLDQGLPIMQGSTLKVCTWVPYNMQTDISACRVIWDAARPVTNASSSFDDTESAYVGEPTASTTLPTSLPTPSTTTQMVSTTTIQLSSITPSITTTNTSSVTPSSLTTIETISKTTTIQFTPSLTTSSVSPSTTTIHTITSTTTVHTPSAVSLPVHPTSSLFSTGSSRVIQDNINITSDKGSTPNQNEARQLQYATDLRDRAVVDELCQTSLIWPVSNLRNSEREDIVFMAFQCWVLGISVVALLSESIPHMCASLVTHVMATGWAGFQIAATWSFHSSFNQIIANGTCRGMPDLSSYWVTRWKAELAVLILNIVAFVIASYLTLRIIKLFGWQTFKRVGASLVINRIYRLVLLLSTAIQLSLFFIATTVSLWIDRLVNSPIGDTVTFRVLYLVSSGITLALLLPWLATGWFGIRRELRLPTFFFLLLSLLYLGGWSVMFSSTTFVWTFVTWRFFSVMALTSVLLVCGTFILGVICRYNFGKGLHRCFNASSPESTDVEKLQFPHCETLVPTFSQIGASPPPTQSIVNASTNVGTVGILASYQSSSTVHSSECQHNEDSSDTHTLAGLSHSSSLSSTRSGGRQEKRWVIE